MAYRVVLLPFREKSFVGVLWVLHNQKRVIYVLSWKTQDDMQDSNQNHEQNRLYFTPAQHYQNLHTPFCHCLFSYPDPKGFLFDDLSRLAIDSAYSSNSYVTAADYICVVYRQTTVIREVQTDSASQLTVECSRQHHATGAILRQSACVCGFSLQFAAS